MESHENIVQLAKEQGHILEILSPLRSGKEATVYRALLDERLIAIKIYKNLNQLSFQHADLYLEGKFYKHASEKRAIDKKNAF
jgi:RIO kinase 1